MTNLTKIANILNSTPSTAAFIKGLSDITPGCYGSVFGVRVYRRPDGKEWQFNAMDEYRSLAEAADYGQHLHFLTALAAAHLAEA